MITKRNFIGIIILLYFQEISSMILPDTCSYNKSHSWDIWLKSFKR